MPLIHHDDIELAAGDDWLIAGTMLDQNGNPEDLTGATLEWMLFDPDGNPVLHDAQFNINVVPQQVGNISINVSSDVTASLEAGRYTDAIRVTQAGGTKSQMWTGNILVACNMFDPPLTFTLDESLIDGSEVLG